jgi:hypothetical protein
VIHRRGAAAYVVAVAVAVVGAAWLTGCAERADDASALSPTSTRPITTTAGSDDDGAVPAGAADLGLLAAADPVALACADAGLERAGIDAAPRAEWPGPAESAAAVFAVVLDCLEGGTRHPIMVEHLERTIERSVGWVVDVDREQARCAMDRLVADSDRPSYLLGVREPESDRLLGGAVSGCLTGPQVEALVRYADELTSGAADGRVGQLMRGCTTANRQECDVLRLLVPEGVDGGLAESCGGSPPSATGFCAIEVDLDVTGYSPPSNPGLETLENACNDGRLNACDSLRAIAPVGSSLVELGETCGGRVLEGAVPDCRAAFSGGRSM